MMLFYFILTQITIINQSTKHYFTSFVNIVLKQLINSFTGNSNTDEKRQLKRCLFVFLPISYLLSHDIALAKRQ